MLHYRCEKCGQKYTGWAVAEICQKCGGKLEELSREEFYEEDKKEVKNVSSKDI